VGASVVTAGLAAETVGVFGAGGTVSPLSAGAMAGGAYAVGSTIFGGGGSITSAQQGYLGSTGSGFLQPAAPTDGHSRAVSEIVASRHIHGALGAGLSGASLLFMGECAEQSTAHQCFAQGLPSGLAPRPDASVFQNNVLNLRKRYGLCVMAGLRGTSLTQCIFRN